MKLVSGIMIGLVVGLVVGLVTPWIQEAYPTPGDARTELGLYVEGAGRLADKLLVPALMIGCLSALPAVLYFGLDWWLARSGGGIGDLRAGQPALVLAFGGLGLYVGTRSLADGMALGVLLVMFGVALLVKGSRGLKSRVLAVFG